MQMNPDYGPCVAWESMEPGMAIYYTGDVANPSGTGVITERLPIDPKWKHRHVNIEMKDGRTLLGIGLADFQPGPGRRFWLASDWDEHRAARIAESMRVLSMAAGQTTGESRTEPTRAGEQSAESLDSRELATVLAALRFMQRLRPALNLDECDIATNGGDFLALDAVEIDALCERLNVAPVAPKAPEAATDCTQMEAAPEIATNRFTERFHARACEPDAQEKQPHELAVGDILVSSWGYDQTNVDFYQVVKRTTKQVTVKKIKSEIVEGDGWEGKCVPKRDAFVGDEIRRGILGYDPACPSIRIDSSEVAHLWNGKPKSFTGYA